MTAFGKLLVYLNVALSLVLVTWAIALYSQRVDWSTNSGQQKGEVFKLRDKLQPSGGWGLLNELQAAQARHLAASKNLDDIDQVRGKNAAFYQKQLNVIDTSLTPVPDIVFENGVLSLDPKTGFPKLAPAKDAGGRDLNGAAYYRKQLETTESQIKMAQDSIAGLKLKDEAVTEEIGGDKGLRYWIKVEKVKKDGIEEETHYLEPLLLNTAVEKELVLRRQKDLAARKVELEKSRLATRQ